MHAGESGNLEDMISRPDTVHLDRAPSESGADQHRQNLPEDVYNRHLVVRAFPQPLLRRRLRRHRGAGQVSNGLVGSMPSLKQSAP